MSIFRGTVTNKIDAKGRISIPARFRSVLEADSLQTLYCHQSLTKKALEGGGRRLMKDVDVMLSDLNPYSDDYDALAHMLIGASEDIPIDKEGRIILPDHFRAYANLEESATFVGLGARFQIWKPEAYQEHFEKSRTRAVELRGNLRSPSAVERRA